LEPCGHANLCFGCVQGLTSHSICFEAIVGWHKKPLLIPLFNPLVLSLTKAFDTSKDPQIPKLEKKKRGPPTRKAKGVAKIQIDDLLDDEQSFDFESSGTDSNEEHSGLAG